MPDDPRQLDKASNSITTPVTTTLEQKVKGETVRTTATTQFDLPSTPAGSLAKIWIALGLVGTVIVVFLSMIGVLVKNSMDQMNSSQEIMQKTVDDLRSDLKQARQDARQDQKDMVDRYLASREANEKKHQELVAKIDKVIGWVDRLADWVFTAMKKSGPEPPPPPKVMK